MMSLLSCVHVGRPRLATQLTAFVVLLGAVDGEMHRSPLDPYCTIREDDLVPNALRLGRLSVGTAR
jgi:hypothetical protein